MSSAGDGGVFAPTSANDAAVNRSTLMPASTLRQFIVTALIEAAAALVAPDLVQALLDNRMDGPIT